MKTIKRRRKENKTDYLKRFNLLKSRSPRLVFRKTNKYIMSQYVLSKEAQDQILFGVNSKDLKKYGWPESADGSLKSITASYLTGYLIGKMIHDKKLQEPIIDFGMLRVLHKSKTYAFIKGVADSGVNISCKKETFPEDERIKGEKMKNKVPFDKIKENIRGKK